MRRVFVGGAAVTRVGEHWGKSFVDLAIEVGFNVLDGMGISPDILIVGNALSGVSSKQEHLATLIADRLELQGIPAYKVEAASASGGVAVFNAFNLVKGGLCDAALVVGVEKIHDLEPEMIPESISMGEYADYVLFFGAGGSVIAALVTRLYMEKYGVTRDELSAFPALAHRNAVNSPHAQYRRALTIEAVSNSPLISDPLRLLDTAPVSDGAAAALLVSEDVASSLRGDLVELLSARVSTNKLNICERGDLLELTASRKAAELALSEAGVSIMDVDVAEIHDEFSSIAALSVEALGFSKKGEGAKDAYRGKFNLDREVPLLTFGGLKARGNPIGATGVYQLAEVFMQLKRLAGPNQVKDARVGLIHNMGGVDSTAVVCVLRRYE